MSRSRWRARRDAPRAPGALRRTGGPADRAGRVQRDRRAEDRRGRRRRRRRHLRPGGGAAGGRRGGRGGPAVRNVPYARREDRECRPHPGRGGPAGPVRLAPGGGRRDPHPPPRRGTGLRRGRPSRWSAGSGGRGRRAAACSSPTRVENAALRDGRPPAAGRARGRGRSRPGDPARRAIGAKKVILAVDRGGRATTAACEAAARACGVATVAVHPIYPIGNDTILVKVLTRRETPARPASAWTSASPSPTPPPASPPTAGSPCGVPFTGRVVTVAGAAAGRAGNFFVPLGTPCAAASLAGRGRRGVDLHGGPMSGRAVRRRRPSSRPAPTRCWRSSRSTPAVAAPCIRCGWCTDHCPARLNVSALNDRTSWARSAGAGRIGALALRRVRRVHVRLPGPAAAGAAVKQLKRLIQPRRHRRRGASPAAETSAEQ